MIENLIPFMMQHWILSSLTGLILLLLLLNEAWYKASCMEGISPQQVIHLMNHQGGVVLDLRSQEAFQQAHILGSLSLPASNIACKIAELKQKHASKPIILISEPDNQAIKQYPAFKAAHLNVVYLLGGINSWRAENLPLVKK